MGVYAVRGLDGDDEGSLRKLLDGELRAAAPERGTLLRKMRGQNMNTVRDIVLWDMMDADDLYGMMVSEYGCSMSRHAFLRKLGSLDRDGTGRLRAAELQAWLKEMVISWAAETEGLSQDEARSNLQAVMHRGLSPTGDGDAKVYAKGRDRAPKSKAEGTPQRSLVSRYLPPETEEEMEKSRLKALQAERRRRVQVIYSSAPSDRNRTGELRRSAPSPTESKRCVGETFWERFQAQSEAGGGSGKGSSRSARIRSAVYNYGPRMSAEAASGGSGVVLRPRTVPSPPVLVQSLEQRRIDMLNAELSEGREKEEQIPLQMKPAQGCVATQTYLTSRNHSHRPTSTALASRPRTSPTATAPAVGSSSCQRSQHSPPAVRPKTSLSPAQNEAPPDGHASRPVDQQNGKWWEVGGHFAGGDDSTGCRHTPSQPEAPVREQVESRAQTAPGTVMARARPMSRYKYRQAENFLTREYRPSKGEIRLGWTPDRGGMRTHMNKGKRAMMADIKLKERPTASALSMRLDAFHQVRQTEARRRGVLGELPMQSVG